MRNAFPGDNQQFAGLRGILASVCSDQFDFADVNVCSHPPYEKDVGMFPGLYSSAKAMQVAERQHEVSASNLAHMNLPGHRRKLFANGEFSSYLNPGGTQQTSESSGTNDLATDFTMGAMKRTGRPLDIAIEGDGFFTLQGPEGKLYTRNGGFQVNTDGEIISVDGLQVLGDTGPLRLPAGTSSEAVMVDPAGRVFAGATQVGQLQVAIPQAVEDLQQVGDTLYTIEDEASVDTVEGNFRQGMLELSNVTPVNELVNLLVASRHYEAAQRTMRAISDAVQNRIDLN